jgi:NitT/TauT family transport system ATP-binding protein
LTLVLVTHAIEEAALLGQRVLVLGRPPHRQPQVLANPGGSLPDHRGTPAYDQACASLRAAMERVA